MRTGTLEWNWRSEPQPRTFGTATQRPRNGAGEERAPTVGQAPAHACVPWRLSGWREQQGKYMTAVHTNPIPERLASSRHFRSFLGRGGRRWRRERLLRGATLPSPGLFLALQSQLSGPRELRQRL